MLLIQSGQIFKPASVSPTSPALLIDHTNEIHKPVLAGSYNQMTATPYAGGLIEECRINRVVSSS
jgi:hypothetical protein